MVEIVQGVVISIKHGVTPCATENYYQRKRRGVSWPIVVACSAGI